MFRIKLPGSNKVKQILLIVLVIFTSCILIREGINNRKKNQSVEIIATDTKKTEVKKLDIPKLEAQLNQNKESENEKAESSKEENQKEDELYQDAYTTFHSNDYSDAISKADEIINQFPNSYKGYSIRGIAKAYNGSFDDGMVDIDKSLEINPNYGYGLFNKALNYERYGHYEDALNWYDKALAVEQYLWSYYGKASIYGRYGDVANSVDNLKKALEIAESQGIKQSVIDDINNEADFDNVRDSDEFQNILN